MDYWEIVKIADEKGIKKEVIDKDWILGHFLNAMFSFPDISENFVFKGGTCLKKIYFKDYRFSEDLDFTLLDKTIAINEVFFNKIIKLAERNSGCKYHLKNIKPQIYKNIPQGYEVTILFWGAFHKPNQQVLPVNRWQTKIKLDISFSEQVIMKPELKDILHPYSDSDKIKSKVPAYPLNEIVAEKLRSLVQRNRPRDIYDLYYLSAAIDKTEYINILNLLKQKSKNKNISCCYFDDLMNPQKYKNNKRAWESSLHYHLPKDKLLDFDTAYSIVEKFVKNILNQKHMKKLVSFIIKAEKGFFKKPDINEGIYLTYNMLHKPALLGILGAIIGLEGYKKNEELPEYYKKLKDIPVGIAPVGAEKGNFQKTVVEYTNTTGFANQGKKIKGAKESGATLIINEQTLIKPAYKIYLLLDLEDENQKKLYNNIKEQKAEYLPYLGKNDYSLWWKKEEVEEYDEWAKVSEHNTTFKISTVFIKPGAIKEIKEDKTESFDLLDFSTITEEKQFVSFERLPVDFNKKLFQYNYDDFAFTTFNLKPDSGIKNLYKINNDIYVQLN